MPPNSLSGLLGEHIVRDKEAHDLSRNPEFASFQFLGYRTTAAAVELVALCDADGLTEGDIVRRRDEFFELVRRLPHDYGLKPRGRNPNGLLAFVYAQGCPEHMARFIARQTRISHEAGTGGVSVAWAVDVPNRRIHTHDNPVSIFPPVVVVARTVYPGLDYLQSLLDGMPAEPPLKRKTYEEFTHGILHRRNAEAVPSAPAAVSADVAGAPASAGNPKPDPDGKTRILFLAANSVTNPMDLEWELRAIHNNLRLSRERDRLAFKPVLAATIDEVMQAMLDDPPHIVHFSGHASPKGIQLRNEAGLGHTVPTEALARLFTLFDGVQCVVLNACWSETQAHAIRRHVPYVVGSRAVLHDETAAAFSTGFYKALGAGRNVPFAFEMGVARVHADGHGEEGLFVLL